MAKYHINSRGNPGVCKATVACPFGGESEHYSTKEAARTVYERQQEVEYRNNITSGYLQDLKDYVDYGSEQEWSSYNEFLRTASPARFSEVLEQVDEFVAEELSEDEEDFDS